MIIDIKIAIGGGSMSYFDKNEVKILKELIKNPRISDNQISKNTGVALKTVNRKRKKLEEKNIINYFTHINHSRSGTGNYKSRQLYIVTFKEGITRKIFTDSIKHLNFDMRSTTKHLMESHLGESDGHLMLIMIIESRVDLDILEIFNADIVHYLKKNLGEDCIKHVRSINLSTSLLNLHNYSPGLNIENGIMSQNWPDDNIFVE